MTVHNSKLPGNPHLTEADHDNGSENFNVAQAILALAFEQRTANLIAAMQPVRIIGGKEWQITEDSVLAIKDQISRRMGL